MRLEPAMRPAGWLRSGDRPADAKPAREIRLRDVTFAYPGGASTPAGTNATTLPGAGATTVPGASAPVLEHFDLTIPAGSSLAIVGQNGAGKTTIAKLLCRLYDPQSGAIEIDLAIAARSTSWEFTDSAAIARSKRRCSRNGSASPRSARSSSRSCGGVMNLTPSNGIESSSSFERKKTAVLGNGVTTATSSSFWIDASATRSNQGKRTFSHAAGNDAPT